MYVGRASPEDVKNNVVTYFDSFQVEHIPKEIKTFIGRPLSSALHNKNIKTNIFRIKTYDSIMCGYFYIGFIDLQIFFHQITLKNIDGIILNYFVTNV